MLKQLHIKITFPYELEGLSPTKRLAPSNLFTPRAVKNIAKIVKHITFEKENFFRGTEDEKI